MNTQDPGNRHSGDLDGKLHQSRGNITIRVSAGLEIAETVAGQHLLWMLINLLARQYGVVGNIEVAVPLVPLLNNVAHFAAQESLPNTLLATIEKIALGRITSGGHDYEDPNNVIRVEIKEFPEFQWAATADGWNAIIDPTGKLSGFVSLDPNPLGPYMAACILAGEVFKKVRGYRGDDFSYEPFVFSLLTHKRYTSLEDVPKAPLTKFELPDLYLVGAGAVGQAFVASLLALEDVSGNVVVIDHDAIDEELTNMNRYALTTPEHKGKNKAELVDEYLHSTRWKCHPFPGTLAQYVQASKPTLDQVLRNRELNGQYEYVISAVDKNHPRHEIQKLWPRLIFGGSTLDLSTTVQIYDMSSDYECLMCANPIEKDDWTIEKEMERLRKLSIEDRKEAAKSVGADINLVETNLREGGCGTLGENEIRKFNLSDLNSDWSVGFVSVSAGVMLAANIVRHFRGQTELDGNAARFSFETLSPFISTHLRHGSCECAGEGRNLFSKIWSSS